MITLVLYTSALSASFHGTLHRLDKQMWPTDCHINSCLEGFCSDNVSERRRILRKSWKIDACCRGSWMDMPSRRVIPTAARFLSSYLSMTKVGFLFTLESMNEDLVHQQIPGRCLLVISHSRRATIPCGRALAYALSHSSAVVDCHANQNPTQANNLTFDNRRAEISRSEDLILKIYDCSLAENVCAECGGSGQPKLLVYSRCKLQYCSQKCQNAHWKQHKAICVAMTR